MSKKNTPSIAWNIDASAMNAALKSLNSAVTWEEILDEINEYDETPPEYYEAIADDFREREEDIDEIPEAPDQALIYCRNQTENTQTPNETDEDQKR